MEVVGVVLGALPLAIEAVKSYQECLQTARSWHKYNDTLENIRNKLFLQQRMLETTWEGFTGITSPTPDQIKQQVMRLEPEHYTGFERLIKHLDRLFAQVLEKLDVDCEGKPRWRDDRPGKRASWEWKRVKNSFGRRDTQEIFDEINQCNQALRLALKTKREVPSDRSNAFTKGQIDKFDKDACDRIRRNADILHKSLGSAWCQSNTDIHISGINLDWHQKGLRAQQSLLLSLPELGEDASNQPKWHGIDVKFHSNNAPCSDIPQPASLLPLSGALEMQPITSLCDRDLRERRSWNGYLAHADMSFVTRVELKREISVGGYLTASHPLRNLVSSKDMFFGSDSGPQHTMSRRDRHAVAAATVWAVLLFCGTSWMQQKWLNKEDLKIFEEDGDSSDMMAPKSGGKFPALMHNFSETVGCASDPGHGTIYAKHETLFSLGIVLIELGLNKSFEKIRNEYYEFQNVPKSVSIIDDFKIADLTLDEVRKEAGDPYGDAVERCLGCQFLCPRRHRNFMHYKFRDPFYSGVVAPVQATYESLPADLWTI